MFDIESQFHYRRPQFTFPAIDANPLMTDSPNPSDSKSETADPPAPPRVVTSESLLEGRTEILITHGNEVYRLRRTRNGKLILQK